jgi:hypothetical protein
MKDIKLKIIATGSVILIIMLGGVYSRNYLASVDLKGSVVTETPLTCSEQNDQLRALLSDCNNRIEQLMELQ